MSDVKSKIRQFLTKYIEHNNFNDDDHLFEKGYVSSLLAMEMVVFVEAEFSIQVGNEDLNLDNFKSVDAIAGLIIKKTDN
ncbi:MAG: acyl carrier protein [Desulfobacteraceae bacterium]|nr:MAG: acyl carrier protein [Desulfobacteraceae bacterium]